MKAKITSDHPCPCCSSLTYGRCCEPFHLGKAKPETAEKLMRSRYCAYANNVIDYIEQTNDPASKESFDKEAAEAWARQSEWLGLDIVATKLGQSGDESGEVEFKAHYKLGGEQKVHHEVSLFERNKQSHTWFYKDGKEILTPLHRDAAKIGRNDPCTCGSGKKYKKCCG